MSTEHVERTAKRNLERGERWHKKLSIKEIVFGFQDNSIAILASARYDGCGNNWWTSASYTLSNHTKRSNGFHGRHSCYLCVPICYWSVEDDLYEEEQAEVRPGNGCCRNPRNSYSVLHRKLPVFTRTAHLAAKRTQSCVCAP